MNNAVMKGKMKDGKLGTLQVSFIDGMRRMELGWQILAQTLTQLRLTPPGRVAGDEIRDMNIVGISLPIRPLYVFKKYS